MNNIEERIEELKKYLNYNKIENVELDKNQIKKCFFKLMRESIKNGLSTIRVGSYTININPDNISVIYEQGDTYVEVSSEDIHKENLISTGISYFVITKYDKDIYPVTTPAIRATGCLSEYDNIIEEIYELTISDDIEDDIRNYIILNSDFSYAENEFSNKYNVTVKRNITPSTSFTDIYAILNKKIVRPVTYNPPTNCYTPRNITTDKVYKTIIPELKDKQYLSSYIYSLIVDFYTEYLNNQIS